MGNAPLQTKDSIPRQGVQVSVRRFMKLAASVQHAVGIGLQGQGPSESSAVVDRLVRRVASQQHACPLKLSHATCNDDGQLLPSNLPAQTLTRHWRVVKSPSFDQSGNLSLMCS